MARKQNKFFVTEVIHKAQTEVICALLRHLPWDKLVPIKRMHYFLNTDSYLADGFLIDSVQLIHDYHYVQMTFRNIDYEKLDAAGLNIQEIDEERDEHLFEEPQTCILRSDAEDENLLTLLNIIYTEAERTIEKFKTNQKELPYSFFLMPKNLRKDITDSLLLESNVVVAEGATKDFTFRIYTCGHVRIVWKDEVYKNRSNFPDDLVEAIRNSTLYNNPDAYVDENNWYELEICDKKSGTHVYSEPIDINLSTTDENEIKKEILEIWDTL